MLTANPPEHTRLRGLAERLAAVELLDDDPPRQRGFFLRGLAELSVRVKAR